MKIHANFAIFLSSMFKPQVLSLNEPSGVNKHSLPYNLVYHMLSQLNKTKEDFSPETRPCLIRSKSLREMLKRRLVVGLINFKY